VGRTAKTSLFEELAATPSDDTTRMVYADALEVAGQLARATFVRTGDGGRELADASEVGWRRAVSPAAIRFCAHDACPRSWGALALGDDPALRTCGTCERGVAYCATLAAIDGAVRARMPIVVDPALRTADADARYAYARRQLVATSALVSELPLFADGALPATIADLERALGIRIPDDTARPPRSYRVVHHPSDLVHGLALHVLRAADGGRPFQVHGYRVEFGEDRAAAEARLHERFGPCEHVHGVYRRYGPFVVAEVADTWTIAWEAPGAAERPTRASEMRLFALPDVPVRVGELEGALQIRFPDDVLHRLHADAVRMSAPPLIAGLVVDARGPHLAEPRDQRLARVVVELSEDGPACEDRLRERYGAGVPIPRDTVDLRMYGPFFVGNRGGRYQISWHGQRPSWGYPAAAHRADFVAALVEHLDRSSTLDDVWQLRPPDKSGCTVGWTDDGRVIVAFRPSIAAVDLARAFGWSEIVAGREPAGYVLHRVAGNSVVLPTRGPFAIGAHVDGAATGPRFRDLELLRHVEPKDVVKFIIVSR
jgi:uncharacterized protein (TIGR02996 family)